MENKKEKIDKAMEILMDLIDEDQDQVMLMVAEKDDDGFHIHFGLNGVPSKIADNLLSALIQSNKNQQILIELQDQFHSERFREKLVKQMILNVVSK